MAKNSANEQMDIMEGKGKGMELDDITISFAENGCTVSAGYKRKAKKTGEMSDYDNKKWVFEDKADVAKKVESLLSEKSDNPGHAY